MSLQELYKTASQIRELSDEKKKLFYQDLKHDSSMIAILIYDYIIQLIPHVLSNRDHTVVTDFMVWNILKKINIDDSLKKTNIKCKTFFTGYYNSTTKTFSYDQWKAAGIGLMVEEVNKLFLSTGIFIQDVSDKNKSFAHVLLVTVPPKPTTS